MATNQPELKLPPRDSDDDLDEMYEEEPRRRAWGAIASVVLALALVFVGYQWNQAASRAESLAAQAATLRVDAESQRLRAEELQRQADGLQKALTALTAEKDTLAERVVALERAAQQRSVARAQSTRGPARAVAAKPGKPRATAVSAKVSKPRATPVAVKTKRVR